MKAQVYKDPRPADYFDRFHASTGARDKDWIYDLVRIILNPFCLNVFRAS